MCAKYFYLLAIANQYSPWYDIIELFGSCPRKKTQHETKHIQHESPERMRKEVNRSTLDAEYVWEWFFFVFRSTVECEYICEYVLELNKRQLRFKIWCHRYHCYVYHWKRHFFEIFETFQNAHLHIHKCHFYGDSYYDRITRFNTATENICQIKYSHISRVRRTEKILRFYNWT